MGGIVKCGDCMKRDKEETSRDDKEETSRDEQEEIGSEEETKRDKQEEIGREEETSRDEQEEIGSEEETKRDEQEEIGREEETSRDEQEEIGSEEETKRDESGREEETSRDEEGEIGSEEETKRDEEGEIGSEEETKRDEQEEIGSEEETSRDEEGEIGSEEETKRDEQEEIGREEETTRDNSPTEREEWESIIRELISELKSSDEEEEIGLPNSNPLKRRATKYEALTNIFLEGGILHKAVERGEIDFVRELTQFRWFDPIGEDGDLCICIFKIIHSLCRSIDRYKILSIDYGSIDRILKLKNSLFFEYFSVDFPININIMELIVPLEDEFNNSFSFEKLCRALLNRMKALVSNVKSPVFRRTPLHVAVLNKKEDIVKYLLEEQDKLEYCVSLGVNWHKDIYGLTPLHYAVLMEDKELVKMLVESRYYSALVNVGDFSLRTPLHLACARRNGQGETLATDVVATLLSNSNVDLNTKDCCGYTPLHWAVHVGGLGAVNLLLERKIKLDEKDVDGNTVLHHVHAAAWLNAGDVQRRETMLELENVVTSDPRVEKRIDRMYRDRQVYVDAANAILVGAALIASVTYGGWLQPPLGDHDEHTRRIARIFWGFNSLSFSFAIAAVMAGAGAVLPVADLFIEDAVARVRDWLAVTAFLLLVSAAFVVGAFGAAGFASMTTVGDLEANMKTTTIVGGAVWLVIALVFLRGLSRVSSVWPTRRLLKGCAGLFSSPSGPLRARSRITLLLLEHLELSDQAVDVTAVDTILDGDDKSHHEFIQFPTTAACRQFCMEADSLFPSRFSLGSWRLSNIPKFVLRLLPSELSCYEYVPGIIRLRNDLLDTWSVKEHLFDDEDRHESYSMRDWSFLWTYYV